MAEEGAPNGTLTTAETQTAGKGRRGRVWKSPEGTSVSMSLLLYPDLEPAKAPMLTIVMGLAVVQGVQRALGVDTR
ncbi:biotin--[acetyl-CoA-carboxylase] ligase, partial [Blautia sp. MSK22_86]|nr:biotin--[acetyl-CoA-carboxylase] ligase [Blautia sp. MSK22_86]